MTALKFNKVKNLPTSGYNVGDVFFVSSEKKIYIRTSSGWEEYNGGFTTAEKTKLAGIEAGANKVTKVSQLTNDEHYINNSTLYEANLQWGGKNLSGTTSPIDAAMIPELSANRFACFKRENGVAFEYSKDGGATWVDYGLTDEEIAEFFILGKSITVGKCTNDNIATKNDMLRVIFTFSPQRNGSTNLYCNLNKLAIYISTNGSNKCKCTVDYSTHDAPENFIVLSQEASITGWSGWNIINFTKTISTYGGVYAGASTYQAETLRITFSQNGSTGNYAGLNIIKIYGFGSPCFIYSDDMMRLTGVPYDITIDNKVYFNKDIKVGTVTEGGTTLSNKYAPKSHTHKTSDITDLVIPDISGKQNKTDNALTTTSKQVVGAINEINANAVHSDKLVPTLEAITIKTDNSTASKAANLAAIKAYVDNLKALGVDVTKGYMIPCKLPDSVGGVLFAVSNNLMVAITTNQRRELNYYEVYIGGDDLGHVYWAGGFQLKISKQLTTTSKQIVGAINEINANAVHSDKLVPTLEAITIKTDNSTASKAANLAAIKAYVDNLKALGVDVTKGYMIPCKLPDSVGGVLFAVSNNLMVAITTNQRRELNYYEVYIGGDDLGHVYWAGGFQLKISKQLTTTSKQIVGAINEINANAVHSDKLVPTLEAITIKTDNSTASKAANLAAIKAYVDNLKALGVDVTKGYMIPCKLPDSVGGVLFAVSNNLMVAITTNQRRELNYYEVYIGGDDLGHVYWAGGFQLKISKQLTTTSKQIVGAINEINANAVHSDKLVPTLEAIAIGDNTPEGKAATKAVIEAYRDNLTALGVDVTKGFMIPIKTNNGNGFILFDGTKGDGYIKSNNDCYGISITADYSVAVNNLMSTLTNYSSLTTTSKRVLLAINEVNALAKSKQDTLTSGTNIKTVNGQSLLGSGDIAISGGGGDVTAAGDNTFTGNNVFNGIAIADILDGTQYQITGDNGVLMFTSGATNEDIQLSGVATPTFSNSAANKQYVDDKVAAAGGVANKLTVTNFDSNSGRPISIQDTDLNDVLYVENNVGTSYDGPMLTIKKYDNGSGSAGWNEYVTNICGKGIEIGSAADGNYDYGTVISKGEILLDGSPVITIETLKNKLPISTRSISSTTAETIRLTSDVSSAHRIILANTSGTKTIQLPANPYDGETFEIIRIGGVSFTLTNNSGKAMQKCTGTTTVTSMNISSNGKYTCIYSSSANRWYVMRDDFVSF